MDDIGVGVCYRLPDQEEEMRLPSDNGKKLHLGLLVDLNHPGIC